jgi:hypothetical protein
MQAVQSPRLASANHLLQLCEEDILAAHATAVATAGRPGQSLDERRLALLPTLLSSCATPPRLLEAFLNKFVESFTF